MTVESVKCLLYLLMPIPFVVLYELCWLLRCSSICCNFNKIALSIILTNQTIKPHVKFAMFPGRKCTAGIYLVPNLSCLNANLCKSMRTQLCLVIIAIHNLHTKFYIRRNRLVFIDSKVQLKQVLLYNSNSSLYELVKLLMQFSAPTNENLFKFQCCWYRTGFIVLIIIQCLYHNFWEWIARSIAIRHWNYSGC